MLCKLPLKCLKIETEIENKMFPALFFFLVSCVIRHLTNIWRCVYICLLVSLKYIRLKLSQIFFKTKLIVNSH